MLNNKMSQKKKILVIGSINIDFVIKIPRIPLAGQNIFGTDFKIIPGGKGANQAIAVARLGKNCVSLIAGKVGKDYFGNYCLKKLEQNKVITDYVEKDSKIHTGTALVMVTNEGENSIVIATGANGQFLKESAKSHESLIKNVDIILLQLELPVDSVSEVIEIASKFNKSTILDAGPPCYKPISSFFKTTIITPNKEEAEALSGISIKKIEDAFKVAKYFVKKGNKAAVIKLGKDGAVLVSEGLEKYYSPYNVKVIDTTAAGDAFTAALSVAIAEGMDLKEAVGFANAAGNIAVTKFGAQSSMPYREELDKFILEIKI